MVDSFRIETGHFEIFASLASLIVVLFKLQAIRANRMHRENKQLFRKLLIEHEIIITDYCERKNIDLTDLPTRHPDVLDGD